MDSALQFLDKVVLPQLGQQLQEQKNSSANSNPTDSTQILPNRLSLKRRFADFKYNSSSNGTSPMLLSPSSMELSKRPSYWAIEKFRDITPALVIAIFEDSLVLEPGDIGPLPISHPVAQELIYCINHRTLSLTMLRKLREFGASLYDGSVVFGIVDYRRWAFAALSSTNSSRANHTDTKRTPPEMHKILLRSPFTTISADVHASLAAINRTHHSTSQGASSTSKLDNAFEIESRIILATSLPLCLDPDPSISRILNAVYYDMEKTSICVTPQTLGYDRNRLLSQTDPIHSQNNSNIDQFSRLTLSSIEDSLALLHSHQSTTSSSTSTAASATASSTATCTNSSSNSGGSVIHLDSSSFQFAESFCRRFAALTKSHSRTGRFRLLHLTTDATDRKSTAGLTPMYGLDARKDPSLYKLSSPPSVAWIPAHHMLWRTIRFINYGTNSIATTNSSASKIRHYTIHVLVTLGLLGQMKFLARLRIGKEPCLGDYHDKICYTCTSRNAIESFIQQFKKTMAMEGATCIVDVANPSAVGAHAQSTSKRPAPSISGSSMVMPYGMTSFASAHQFSNSPSKFQKGRKSPEPRSK